MNTPDQDHSLTESRGEPGDDDSPSVGPAEGLGVLHLFVNASPGGLDADMISASVNEAIERGDQVVSVCILGHKADACFMILGSDLWSLRRFQTDLTNAGLIVTDSYFSLTEVSEYAKGLPAEMLNARLYPQLPPDDKPAFCFYPMSKRRDTTGNWYTLDFEARTALMHGHGRKGREFAGKVLQLITGSTGLDNYEWGVTLFAIDPSYLKQVVYEMRFDEASAVYAEFGPFVTGLVADLDKVLEHLV